MIRFTSSIDLLNKSLTIFQLAREAAIGQGNHALSEQLVEIIEQFKKILQTAHEPAQSSIVTGMLGQKDFRTLLSVIQTTQPEKTPGEQAASDRNQMIIAMAVGGVQELEIARRLGMTRDEVRTVIQLHHKKNLLGGSSK